MRSQAIQFPPILCLNSQGENRTRSSCHCHISGLSLLISGHQHKESGKLNTMMIVKPNIRNRIWEKDGLKFLPLCYFKYSLHQNIFLFLPTRSEFGSHPMCAHTSLRPSLLPHRRLQYWNTPSLPCIPGLGCACISGLGWSAQPGSQGLLSNQGNSETHTKNHKALSGCSAKTL